MSLELEHNTVTHDVTDTEAVYAMQARPTDDQDRVLVEYLTDSEKLTEVVNYMRGFTDLMTALSNEPMIGKMLGLKPGMFKR